MTVESLLDLATSAEPLDRREALLGLCTCHVKADDERIWPELLRLFDDDDVRVRRAALHALTDSTPASRIAAVVAALEARYGEPDPSLRRRIRRTLSHHRRTGALTDAPR